MARYRPTVAAELPRGWFVKESLTLISPDGQANLIFSLEVIDENLDSHGYADAQATVLRNNFGAYREFAYGPSQVFGGRPGYYRQFEWTPEDGIPVTHIQQYFADNGRGYTATVTTPSSLFPAVESVLRDLLVSLTIESGS
jgi:hypothetical protein